MEFVDCDQQERSGRIIRRNDKTVTLQCGQQYWRVAYEWELWHYSPALIPDNETVDPLFLTLSLQDDADERVQLALIELKERFTW